MTSISDTSGAPSPSRRTPHPSLTRPATVTVIVDDELAYVRLASALCLLVLDPPYLTRLRSNALRNEIMNLTAADLVVVFSYPRLATRSGLRLLRRLVSEASLILVVPELTPARLRKALDAGVDGIVLEEQLGDVLASTAQAVLAGQVAVPRRVLRQATRPALSPREKQTLGMVIMGFTNSEIASKLHLAESTVKTHLSSAFEKLGVRSRHEAAALILDPEAGLGTGILSISDAEPAQKPVDKETELLDR